jgi:WhiB family redox-sensing transcriptional regulator
VSTSDRQGQVPWRTRGACFGMAVDRFFPIGENGAGARRATSAAKVICGTCAVVADCLVEAMVVPDTDGIWGGLTSTERRALTLSARITR